MCAYDTRVFMKSTKTFNAPKFVIATNYNIKNRWRGSDYPSQARLVYDND